MTGAAAPHDFLAIQRQLSLYCRAMDRIDATLGYGVWHADGTADYGSLFTGSGRGFVDWACALHRTMLGHSHLVSNLLVETRGDMALSEVHVIATLRRAEGDAVRQTTVHGRYLDRWSHRDGRWAIDRRRFVQDFSEVRVVEAGTPGLGRRDTDDPSYRVLGFQDIA